MTRILAVAVLALTIPAAGLAQPQQARVVVVPPFPAERYADRGAVGLLVPGAGPTVSREGALAALVRGRVEHSLLGGRPGGAPLIALGGPPRPLTIYVSLPPSGKRANDIRYGVAVVGGGFRGLLESDATRIPGLVSIADVAPTALGREDGLRWRAARDAPERLEALDERIDRNDDVRLPLSLVAATAIAALALLAPAAAVAALIGVLAANLLAGLVGAGFARRSDGLLGLAAGGAVLAYALALWLDPTGVALSPLGPSQSGRFYGLSNLLSTLLLVPAFAGTALLWPWGAAVGLLALVTVGASGLGADGGGAFVLAAGLLVLALRLRGDTLTAPRLALVAAGAAALALALVGLDVLAGGSSHVTQSLSEGPTGVARDLADRLELSARRALSSWGAALVVVAGIAVLWRTAVRRPRRTVTDALLLAVAVSLLVNDTPTDVAGFGALAAVATRRWEDVRSRRPWV